LRSLRSAWPCSWIAMFANLEDPTIWQPVLGHCTGQNSWQPGIELSDLSSTQKSATSLSDEPVKVQLTDSGPEVEPPTEPALRSPEKKSNLASANEALALENARLAWENKVLKQQQEECNRLVNSGLPRQPWNELSDCWWPPYSPCAGDQATGAQLGIQPGAVVQFFDLKSAVDLNGEFGMVDRWDNTTGRWVVRLRSSEEKFAKAENLVVANYPYCFPGYYPDALFGGCVPASGLQRSRTKRSARGSKNDTTGSFSSDTTTTGSVRSSVSSEDSADLSATEAVAQTQTTVMMRNIPNNYTRAMLLRLLDAQGFAGSYDLVYLPIDYQSKVGFGYAFINLCTPEKAERFWNHFEGFSDWDVVSQKICEVSWSSVLQGVQAHIDRYRNSPVMHEAVPDEFKPVLFVDGERVSFPIPTKAIRAPRVRRKDPK